MINILCVHGIGGKDADIDSWSEKWKRDILKSTQLSDSQVTFTFLKYDFIFKKYEEANGIAYATAGIKLIKDWIITSWFREAKAFGIMDAIRWHAGMVAQFVTDTQMRKELCTALADKIAEVNPDYIFSHSLGTLICYDFLRQETVKKNPAFKKLTLITSGSQIGHPALLRTFGGKIQPLHIRRWVNLHNQNDKVFAYEPIALDSDNFAEIETPFIEGSFSINHEALEYISHINAVHQLWSSLKYQLESIRPVSIKKGFIKSPAGKKVNTQKALLVGINNYPDPENQLNGCLNDVFRISEVLQEAGMKPDQIKVLFDERATSENLRDQMDWLLKDAKDGDFRFFYYSGHGAQIPSGGMNNENDSLDECLVTYDFDWTPERAFTDKEFLRSYSHLSYGVDFMAVLDCCHSGGMARDGFFKARGISLPDDIRHRTIKWDASRKMWIPREMQLSKMNLFKPNDKNKEVYVGKNKNTNRMGRAIPLWQNYKEFEKTKKTYGTYGPYMPVIIESCREDQYAYEYKHGVTSYGAFTYCFTTALRSINENATNKKFTYEQLVKRVAEELKKLEYNQTPQILGPKIKTQAHIPLLNI